MSRKRKRGIVVGSEGRSWDLDDFDLDSHGFVAPLQERFESLMQGGFTPEQVSVDIREKYAKYLERKKKNVASGTTKALKVPHRTLGD